ncbi:adenosylcobinamide-GDP ribazoletransferase [Ferribacterium limneticum]|uniref:adenosylcobinamide-GDP ribazoletransferase n=1 Tax=Ferribacterium limneticum TaxID=76259 RepID=UPI001CF9B0A8|nr:adenosylcobinamide-GDP ribazoletransferase [Ferribacterium limneticum]UCV19167.1 adenosylcobinamide-GDP ribazoletransferase [Ferribacterium limneticum]
MIRRELATFFAALGYFTRLPVPGWVGYSADGLARAARYLPLIGLLVGGVGALVFWLASQVWAQPVAVVLSMVATIALTGAFHEDGLADTADGLGGGWDKAKILAIMKDSRVGSYGVITVVLALLGKFALLSTLPAGQVVAALIAGHAVSRFCAVSLMATMDYARDDETSKARPVAARLGLGPLLFALVFAGLPFLLLAPEPALTAVALAALATIWLAAKCRRWLGGYTGDCLGAVQQVAEIAFYLGLAAHF